MFFRLNVSEGPGHEGVQLAGRSRWRRTCHPLWDMGPCTAGSRGTGGIAGCVCPIFGLSGRVPQTLRILDKGTLVFHEPFSSCRHSRDPEFKTSVQINQTATEPPDFSPRIASLISSRLSFDTTQGWYRLQRSPGECDDGPASRAVCTRWHLHLNRVENAQ